MPSKFARQQEPLRLSWTPEAAMELARADSRRNTDTLAPYHVVILSRLECSAYVVRFEEAWQQTQTELGTSANRELFEAAWDELQRLAHGQVIPDDYPLQITWGETTQARLRQLRGKADSAETRPPDVESCEAIVLQMLEWTPPRLHGLLNFRDAWVSLQREVGSDSNDWRRNLSVAIRALRS